MSFSTVFTVILIGVLIFFTTFLFLKSNKIPVKFSLLWFFIAVVLILVGLAPNLIVGIANIFGFKTISNLLVGILIVMLIFVTMALTIIVSDQKSRIILLTQELSILKKKIKELENMRK